MDPVVQIVVVASNVLGLPLVRDCIPTTTKKWIPQFRLYNPVVTISTWDLLAGIPVVWSVVGIEMMSCSRYSYGPFVLRDDAK